MSINLQQKCESFYTTQYSHLVFPLTLQCLPRSGRQLPVVHLQARTEFKINALAHDPIYWQEFVITAVLHGWWKCRGKHEGWGGDRHSWGTPKYLTPYDREPVTNVYNINPSWFVQGLEKLGMSIAGARKRKGTKFIECLSLCTFYYYYLV